MRTLLLTALLVNAFLLTATGQTNLEYQKPPQEILDLVDVEMAPRPMMNADRTHMVLRSSDQFASIAQLSQEELRLAGLRIDPLRNIGSRTRYSNNLQVMSMASGSEPVQVTGLPEDPRLANFAWSPDQSMVAMTHTTVEGVEVWVLDIEAAAVRRVAGVTVNANLGDALNWFEDGKSILVKALPDNRAGLIDTQNSVPTGPTISVADGKKAQNRTYQDLLKNANDEHNFEQLALSSLVKVDLDGTVTTWKAADMFDSVSFSPDGEYVMVTTVKRPFSYLVPYYRFASETNIYTRDGKLVSQVADDPLVEDLPQGFMSTTQGKRSWSWRADRPASLIYAVALDKGDPAVEVDYRDEVFQLDAPFKGEGRSLMKTINRFSGIRWGDDQNAMCMDYWWNTRNTKAYHFNPSNPKQAPKVVVDRNYQDAYSDPGSPVMKRNEYGSAVLAMSKGSIYMIGDGFTPEGQFPFVESFNLASGKKKRIYTSTYTDKVEDIYDYDPKKGETLVRIESSNEFPNFFMRKGRKLTQITRFENPFKGIEDIHKEVITYQREDGVELSGTLYLPVGYDMEKKEKVPMILWAYPEEFKDKASAGQNTKNPNRFTYPWYGSMIFWVTRGYAVLDDAAFPIIGEGEEEPNDSFRSQLVANGKAAIDAVDALGYIDRDRVAVGGHSYGAFMVANLLSHCDLFAAGIARSGAYNRTLTPFGFQSEERSYWDAPEVYYTMSPFMHADKMDEPLLLIHGEADNNSGTYPMQSERYFNALKGLGATVRLVMLPKESHGYRAKESILHVLWEQDMWLEKYVKNKEAG